MIPATGVAAPDLGARFSSVLSKLEGRQVGVDALFEALKLEVLDWGFDHDIAATMLDTQKAPEPVNETEG